MRSRASQVWGKANHKPQIFSKTKFAGQSDSFSLEGSGSYMQMLLIYLTVSGMLHHGHHISLYNTPTNPYLEIKIDSSVKINQIYIILIFIPDQFSRFKPFSRIINLFLFTFLFLFPQLFPSLLAAFDMLFMAFLRSHFQIAFFSSHCSINSTLNRCSFVSQAIQICFHLRWDSLPSFWYLILMISLE